MATKSLPSIGIDIFIDLAEDSPNLGSTFAFGVELGSLQSMLVDIMAESMSVH
jgi:hypothetical protein